MSTNAVTSSVVPAAANAVKKAAPKKDMFYRDTLRRMVQMVGAMSDGQKALNDAFNEQKLISWNAHKRRRQVFRDLKLTFLYATGTLGIAYTTFWPLLATIVGWPYVWRGLKTRSEITPSYALPEDAPFFTARKLNFNDSRSLAALFHNSVRALGDEKSVQMWAILNASLSKGTQVDQNLMSVFRTMSQPLTSEPIPISSFSSAHVKAAARLMCSGPFFTRLAWARVVKRTQEALQDAQYIKTTEDELSMTDVREMLCYRAGIPEELVESMSIEKLSPLVESYLSFCDHVYKSQDEESQAATFVFTKAIINAYCQTQLQSHQSPQ